MNIQEFHALCMSLPGTQETFPFDEDTLVFKVLNKVYAITSLEKQPFTVNLKCDPDRAIQLREQYGQIQPGWHMNKKHWNTVDFESDLDRDFLQELIEHSYNLVVTKLPKKDREYLKKLAEDG